MDPSPAPCSPLCDTLADRRRNARLSRRRPRSSSLAGEGALELSLRHRRASLHVPLLGFLVQLVARAAAWALAVASNAASPPRRDVFPGQARGVRRFSVPSPFLVDRPRRDLLCAIRRRAALASRVLDVLVLTSALCAFLHATWWHLDLSFVRFGHRRTQLRRAAKQSPAFAPTLGVELPGLSKRTTRKEVGDVHRRWFARTHHHRGAAHLASLTRSTASGRSRQPDAGRRVPSPAGRESRPHRSRSRPRT
jgi:hypothetical protein